MISIFKNLLKYRWLLEQLIARDMKLKYKRSILGYSWSLLNPLLMMVVMTIVFSHFFRFAIKNYPIYLLTGQVIFNYFSEATSMAMSSVIQSGGLIKKVHIPHFIFPLSRILSSMVNMGFSLLAIAIMLVITKTPISWTILLIPIPLFYLSVIVLGVGLILSTMAVYFRDVIYLYGIAITALMYFTPVFYPVTALPSKVQFFIKFNPLYHIIDYFRKLIIYHELPTVRDNLVCVAFCILSLSIGAWVFKKWNSNFLHYV